jgi:hypothetical protein
VNSLFPLDINISARETFWTFAFLPTPWQRAPLLIPIAAHSALSQTGLVLSWIKFYTISLSNGLLHLLFHLDNHVSLCMALVELLWSYSLDSRPVCSLALPHLY